MITVTVFHVSSDLLMLLIPAPMIARARLPMVRKVILVIIFSLGLLVVLVAILNRYYNFTIINSYIFLIWYNGEASTAVMVANIPFCWTLLRNVFSLDAWTNSSRRSRNASGAQRLDDNDPGSSAANAGTGTGPRSQLSHLRHQQHAQNQQAINQKAIAASQKFFSETSSSSATTSGKNNSKNNTSTKHSSLSLGGDPFKSESMERMTEEDSGGTSLQRLDSKPDSTSDSVPDSMKHGDIEMTSPAKLHLHHRNSGGVRPASNDRDVELGL